MLDPCCFWGADLKGFVLVHVYWRGLDLGLILVVKPLRAIERLNNFNHGS